MVSVWAVETVGRTPPPTPNPECSCLGLSDWSQGSGNTEGDVYSEQEEELGLLIYLGRHICVRAPPPPTHVINEGYFLRHEECK